MSEHEHCWKTVSVSHFGYYEPGWKWHNYTDITKICATKCCAEVQQSKFKGRLTLNELNNK